jgi:hypothetical protein
MPRPFYPRRNIPRCPLDRSVSGPQNGSGRCRKKTKISPIPGLELRLLGRPARRQLPYWLRSWCSFIHKWLYSPLLGHSLFLSSVNFFYTHGRTPWTSDQPVSRSLPTHRTTQTQNKRIQTCMPWVCFEPTIPVSKRAKTVHALNRAVTVIAESWCRGQESWNKSETEDIAWWWLLWRVLFS